jgi:hypothetical protein
MQAIVGLSQQELLRLCSPHGYAMRVARSTGRAQHKEKTLSQDTGWHDAQASACRAALGHSKHGVAHSCTDSSIVIQSNAGRVRIDRAELSQTHSRSMGSCCISFSMVLKRNVASSVLELFWFSLRLSCPWMLAFVGPVRT